MFSFMTWLNEQVEKGLIEDWHYDDNEEKITVVVKEKSELGEKHE